MKQILSIILLLTSFAIANIQAQTFNIWNAGADGNWNVDGNWSLGHVPTENEIAEINTNFVVTIPSAITATCTGVKISDSGELTIETNATLEVIFGSNTGVNPGIRMNNDEAMLTNNGNIIVTGNNSDGTSGIFATGTATKTIINNGTIQITNIIGNGIAITETNFTNEGTITINTTKGRCISMSGSSNFDNNSGAIVNLFNSGSQGDLTSSFRATSSSIFNNKSGAIVNITGTGPSADAIDGGNFNSFFNNSGIVNISEVGSQGKIIDNSISFVIKDGGELRAITSGNRIIKPTSFSIENGGILSPGISPTNTYNTIRFDDGDVDFSNGVFDIEIGNPNNNSFDKIRLDDGTATITDATLDIAFALDPCVGDRIEILSADVITGNFSVFNVTPNTVTVSFDNSTGEVVVTGNGTTPPNPNITIIETSGNVDNDGNICSGESATLDAGSFASYKWSTSQNIQIIPVTIAGNYSVTVTDANGCKGEDMQMVTTTIPPSPNIAIDETSGNTDDDGNICLGESADLDAGSFDSYVWSTGEISQMISVSMTSNYSVVVSDASGCTGEDMQMVTATSLPIISISIDEPNGVTNDGNICAGQNVILDAGSFDTYLWSTTETSQMISVTMTGNYSVTVEDTNGCTSTTTQMVTSTIPSVSLVIDGSSSVSETGGTLTYRFTRADCSEGDLTLHFSIAGSASDDDFTVDDNPANISYNEGMQTGTVQFSGTDTTIDLEININGDSTVEENETIIVKIEPAP